MRAKRYYIYKCVVDDGGAPCVDDGVYTLTICKPYIRRTARKGDLIFAFGSNGDATPNRLVYIAQVSRHIPNGQYFEEAEFQGRSDCIYKRLPDGKLESRRDAKFHKYDAARISDLGDEPHYPNANALLSEDFRYFGRIGTNAWKANAPYLKELIENLGQGHRVNLSDELLEELVSLKDDVWLKNPDRKILGKPLHAANRCIDDDADDIVEICGRNRCYVPKVKC